MEVLGEMTDREMIKISVEEFVRVQRYMLLVEGLQMAVLFYMEKSYTVDEHDFKTPVVFYFSVIPAASRKKF